MVSGLVWYIFTGSATGSNYSGSSGMTCNFKNIDASDNNVTYSSYPIVTGSNSYAVFLKAQFTGSFDMISNTAFYMSTGSTGSGTFITCGLNAAYTPPFTTGSADPGIPTTLPASNVNAPGTGSGPQVGYCPSGSSLLTNSFIRLQLQTSTLASPGDTPQFTFTLQWQES